MLRKQFIAGILGLVITATPYAQTSGSAAKSYELYSWKIKGHWYYSLVPRTDRLKSYEEITAPGRVRRDAAGLKSELQKLPRGEEVHWMADAPAGATGHTINVKHPSRERIKGIKAICDKLGIKLKLT